MIIIIRITPLLNIINKQNNIIEQAITRLSSKLESPLQWFSPQQLLKLTSFNILYPLPQKTLI